MRASLVLGSVRARGQNRNTVVTGKVQDTVGGAWLESVTLCNHRARVVGNNQLNDTTYEVQCAGHTFNPVNGLLALRGQCVGVARRTERGHENVCPTAIAQT